MAGREDRTRRVSLRDVLTFYDLLDGPGGQAHGQVVVRCPFHLAVGTLQVDLDAGQCRCSAPWCGRTGTAVNFAAAMEGLSVRSAALLLQYLFVPSAEAPASAATAAPVAGHGKPSIPLKQKDQTMHLNKVFILGNLTRVPDLRTLPSTGTAVASMGVATNRVWTDQSGKRQDSAEFHQVVLYGKQAETAAQYLARGQLVLVEGRLQTRAWEQDGVRRFRTEIIAERVQFGPKRDTDDVTDDLAAGDLANDNIPF